MPMTDRKINIVYKWFISIVAILAFILALNVGFNFFSLRYLEEETLTHYESSTNLLKTSVDMRLAGLENVVNELGIKPAHIRLMNAGGGSAGYRKDAYSLIRELKAFKVANPLISDIFVYYPQSGHVVGSEGIFEAGPYYHLSDFKRAISRDEWAPLIGTAEPRRFRLIGETDNGSGGLMIFKQTMPVGDDSPKATIITVVNEAEISRILASVRISVSPRLILIRQAEKGAVYAYYGNDALLRAIPDEDYLVTRIESDYGHIHYMVINEKSDVLKSSGVFRDITLIGVLICMVLGGLLAYFISKKNNTRVTSYINTVIDEKSKISGELEKQRVLLRRSALAKMLKEGEPADESTLPESRLLRAQLPLPRFVTAVINWEPAEDAGERSTTDEERLALVEDALRLAAGTTGFEVCGIDGNVVIAVNLPNDGQVAVGGDTEEEALNMVERTMESLSREAGGSVKAGIGGVYDFSRMTLSYHEAAEALEYTLESDDRRLCRYADIEKEQTGAVRPFTDMLSKLAQSIRTKDYDEAETAVHDIFALYLATAERPEYAASRRNAYIQFVTESVEAAGERDAVQALFAAKSLKALKNESLAVLSRLRRLKEEEDQSESKLLTDRAKRMIDEEYANPDMSLDWIARQLGMNHTQLSKAFKRHYGLGISEYLNKVRIEASKNLLGIPGLTLKEIAGKVGYASDINFIRVFKKYEGVTPRNFSRT